MFGGSSGDPFSSSGLGSLNAQFGTGGNNPLVPILRGAQAGSYGGVAGATAFGNNLEGPREGILNNLINLNSVGGIQAQAARNANQITENASKTGQQTGLALQGMGLGSGVVGGAVNSAGLQGAAAVNASNQYFNNPAYQSQTLQAGLGAIGQGMQNPLLQQDLSYEPTIMGQNTFNYQTQGQGLWGQIAPLIGSFLGGGGGGALSQQLFGGGSGGGSGGGYFGSPAQMSSGTVFGGNNPFMPSGGYQLPPYLNSSSFGSFGGL